MPTDQSSSKAHYNVMLIQAVIDIITQSCHNSESVKYTKSSHNSESVKYTQKAVITVSQINIHKKQS